MKMPSEPTRAYLYNLALAVVPLLVALGMLTSSMAPLVLGVVAALLSVGMARANVTRKP